MLHHHKRKKDLFFGGLPVAWPHGEIAVLVLPGSKLLLEILERIEFMRGVKLPVVFPVTALRLVVVSGCKRTDFELRQCLLKQSWWFLFDVSKFIGILRRLALCCILRRSTAGGALNQRPVFQRDFGVNGKG